MDSSDIGKHVFDEAMSLAKASDARLMLLHVLSPEAEESPLIAGLSSLHYYPVMSDEILLSYHQQWDEFVNNYLELLRSYCAEAHVAGVSAEFRQTPGSPSRTICEFAGHWEADLIVMGRRGRSGLSELILGSVSNYVLHHAPCSILIVNRQAHSMSEAA